MLPTKRAPIRIAITISVRPAFFACGGWNAGTPLLIASIPVRAVQPVENVCRISSRVSGCTAAGATAASGVGPSIKSRTNP